MLQAITLSQPCVKTYSIESKQVVKGVHPVNGVQEKHRWLRQPIKKQVVDTEDNATLHKIINKSN